MKINSIRIRNFRSIYNELFIDFTELQGIVKLSGIIGAGKTTLGEAILYGLYGKVKDHKNPDLVSWHMKNSDCMVELNLTSKNKEINIKRSLVAPIEVKVDGKLLSASNKLDMQEILEQEYYDVPKLAIEKMCIISFNAFKNSLAAMNPSETRQFLDDIFGFKTFTEYNNQIVIERKTQVNENNQLNAILEETKNQIENLKNKQISQTYQLKVSLDIDKIQDDRTNLINNGIELNNKKKAIEQELVDKNAVFDKEISEYQNKMVEVATLGKQSKNNYNTFKSGRCPTCGREISTIDIEKYRNEMNEYAAKYREYESLKKQKIEEKTSTNAEYDSKIQEIANHITEIKNNIVKIDADVKSYNDSVQLINDNYDEIISELLAKCQDIEAKISKSDKDIGEWNDMNELFSKTLRYSLLDSLIPHINKSIKFYLNKLNQLYNVEYDQEFKPHIYFENNEKEINYSDLSTGQKKTLDIGIIFGIIANVIANVDFNLFFLDELFSNMDSDSRNTMLDLLQNQLKENRTIFVVNHAEMSDDYFDHKIRVKLEVRKIVDRKEPIIVYVSKYEKIF